MSTKGISIGILIFIIVVVIVYAIVMLEMSAHKSGIFSPYTPPNPPGEQQAFYPLGTVTPLCQQDIIDRNKIICASYFGGYTRLTAGQIDTTGWTGPCDPSVWPKVTAGCPATPLDQTPSNLNPSSIMFRQTMTNPS